MNSGNDNLITMASMVSTTQWLITQLIGKLRLSELHYETRLINILK